MKNNNLILSIFFAIFGTLTILLASSWFGIGLLTISAIFFFASRQEVKVRNILIYKENGSHN